MAFHVFFHISDFFDRYISNVVSKNIFVWHFIYFYIIPIKILFTDNIMGKVACAVPYIHILLIFIAHLLVQNFS